MAYCYDPRNPEVHPPETQAECSLGLIRPSTELRSVCVDGGMYAGAREYLEIGIIIIIIIITIIIIIIILSSKRQ
jgi:hypothetical protein